MSLLNETERRKLEAKIGAMENLTSAEFKIVICDRAWIGSKRKAARLFKKYGLDRTTERNAVLLLVLTKDRELVLFGDKGIYQKSTTQHWPAVRNAIIEEFKKDEYYVGLSIGIEMIAENLIQHFPGDNETDREISNEIIYY